MLLLTVACACAAARAFRPASPPAPQVARWARRAACAGSRRCRAGPLPAGGPPPSALGRASSGGGADSGVMHRSASVSPYQPPQGIRARPCPRLCEARGPRPSSPSEGERAYGCAEIPTTLTGIRPCLLPNECSDVSAPGCVIPLPSVAIGRPRRASREGVSISHTKCTKCRSARSASGVLGPARLI